MLPLIAQYQPDRVFAWRRGQPVRCGQAMAEILALEQNLTPATHYINLCEQRYNFTVAFAAIGLAGGINLLPHSRNPKNLRSLREDYPDALTIDDDLVSATLESATVAEPPDTCPSLPSSRCLAIVFTSGSTGRPGQHRKYWADLVLGGDLYRQRFFPQDECPHTVATVPPQHMYGLETSVLPALQLGFAVEAERPFMPWSVAEALARVPAPRLLVTTPVHLRACLDAGVAMPGILRVISATAPLDADLARAVEYAWQTEVHEIYGCTETGSVASRRTVETDTWVVYDGMTLTECDGFWLRGPQLPEAFRLSDDLALMDAQRFRLLGRHDDMLKIAGKRLSVHELTRYLLAIDGVEDAVAVTPEASDGAARPAALVVAPTLGERDISAQLAESVDPVFVPRPIVRVEQLPRNAVGKMAREDLLALLQPDRSRWAAQA